MFRSGLDSPFSLSDSKGFLLFHPGVFSLQLVFRRGLSATIFGLQVNLCLIALQVDMDLVLHGVIDFLVLQVITCYFSLRVYELFFRS